MPYPDHIHHGDPELVPVPAELREQARDGLARHVQRAAEQRRSATDWSDRAMRLTHDRTRAVLSADDEYQRGMRTLWTEFRDRVRGVDKPAERVRSAISDEAALRFLDQPFSPLAPLTDPHLDVFAAPYADAWTDVRGRGTPHHRQAAWADRSTGEIGFDYQIFPEPGDIACGAAVWVNFMRQSPGHPPGQGPAGSAQIRTYTPYDYTWNDQSSMERADNSAGFGFYVVSWDLAGGDLTVEQEYRYPQPVWDDVTDWNWNHANPGWPVTSSDVAFWNGPQQTPLFSIRPQRMYSAAIWCFGQARAAGDQHDHGSYAEATLAAHVRLVVVAQQ